MELLQRSWYRAWTSVGVPTTSDRLFDQLLACYAEPHRKYHTLQHLSECLSILEPALELAAHTGEVEIALWFHDAVYTLNRQDNELQSAIWAKKAALDAAVALESAERIFELVIATQHATLPSSPDQSLLVDVDLSILGASIERFDEYEEQVRQEYAAVPDKLFRRKRRAVLQAFLARQFIYGTRHCRTIFELRARENLHRSITRLED